MIVDSSAIVALVAGEPGWETIRDLLNSSPDSLISTVSVVESSIVLESRLGPDGYLGVERVLSAMQIQCVAPEFLHVSLAVQGFRRFGKGRHPARLNLGDCFVYALAKALQRPILCLGQDFAQTDAAVVPLN